ncbi:SDR family oxidoreductase [Roseomonas sp. BN140053]|uniref:SDR family oxidoreductase n=1 Tax=Roseomonas sp. BN140053 TaxID=3391898 RepID=UPI0039EB1511
MDLGLRNKRALVMGASKGLGRSVAEALAAEGVALAVSGREQGSLDTVCDALRALGAPQAVGIPADTGSGEQMAALAQGAIDALGGVDIVLLNHGGPPPGTALELTEAALQTWFRHVVLTPIQVANALLPGMRERRWGRILTVGSMGMEQPIPNLALSNVLRAAIVGWNKSLSLDVAAEGVTCNILAPGAFATDRTLNVAKAESAKTGRSVEEIRAERSKTIPVGRYGEPKEYGPMAAFLASDHAAYITGSIVRVDGGAVRSI